MALAPFLEGTSGACTRKLVQVLRGVPLFVHCRVLTHMASDQGTLVFRKVFDAVFGLHDSTSAAGASLADLPCATGCPPCKWRDESPADSR